MSNQEPLSDRLRHFFYDEEVPYGLALCRICLPLVLMGMVLPRWAVCRELYSADGATGQLSVGYLGYDLLPELPGSVIVALYTIMVISMVTVSVGWCTRASALISFVLFTYFCMMDCVSTMTKYTVITSHVLFILALSDCGSIWSVDAWLSKRERNLDPTKPTFVYRKSAAWPRRLLQLLICYVYFGAAITKIHTPSFFSGDQLQYWMLTHLNYQHPFGELLSLYPIILVAMGYVTVVWEISFILCAWKSAWRTFYLAVGILFHFMTTLTLGLLMFPMVCYSTYFSFLDDEDVAQTCAWLRRKSRRLGWLKNATLKLSKWRSYLGERPEWKVQSRTLFATALPAAAMMAVMIEYQFDLYGERRPEGRHQLLAIEPDHARQMLAPVTPQRDIDKFFAVDLGTFLISDLLADRRTTFRQGEKMICQCNLIPPHDDMTVECVIRDRSNRLVERLVSIGTREMFRVNLTFPIGENMEPGEYSMDVQTAGRHVMNKKFTIVPKYPAVAKR